MGQFGGAVLVYFLYFGIFAASAALAAGVVKVLPRRLDDSDAAAWVFLPLLIAAMVALSFLFGPSIHELKKYSCRGSEDFHECMGDED